MQPIRLVIADDHHVFVDGLKALLETEKTLEVVGQVYNGKQLIEKVAELGDVDVVISDISMPVMNGIEATTFIRKEFPTVKVIALTMHEEYSYIEKLIQAGVSGYILKNAEKIEFITAITKVFNGENYLSGSVTSVVLSKIASNNSHSHSSTLPNFSQKSNVHITEREIEIIALIARGLTSPQIARELFISTRTVETHRKNILQKLEVKNTAELICYAIDNNIVQR